MLTNHMQMACEVGVQLQSTEMLFPLTTILYLGHIPDAVTGLEGRVPSRSSLCSSLLHCWAGLRVRPEKMSTVEQR